MVLRYRVHGVHGRHSCANFADTIKNRCAMLRSGMCPMNATSRVLRWEVLANNILAGIRVQLTLARHLKLRSFAFSDHVVPRRFTELERDSGHIGLRSSASGGRADTTASQGQKRQGLVARKKALASRRRSQQTIRPARPATCATSWDTTRGTGLLARERPEAKVVARATAK